MGSGTDSNLTPRPGKDTTTGLSITREKPTGKFQIFDVKVLNDNVFIVVQDGKKMLLLDIRMILICLN